MQGGNSHTSALMALTTCKEFKDWEVAFVGIGLPLIAGIVAKKCHAPNLSIVYESGCIGPEKFRVDFNVGDSSAADGALCLTSEWRVFSDLQSSFYDIGVIGGAQIDKYGNLNTTAIFGDGDYYTPKVRLPGSGGGNDIGSSVGRTVIMMRLEKNKFVPKVDFCTTPGYLDGSSKARKRAGLVGSGPVAVITDKGMFRFDPDTREMYLHTLFPGISVEEVRDLIAWDIKVSKDLKVADLPTDEELQVLTAADPANLILGGAAARKKLSAIDEYMVLTLKYAQR